MGATSTEHRDTKAWEAGMKAGEEGKPLSKCPHAIGSIQAISWCQGHAAGSVASKKDH